MKLSIKKIIRNQEGQALVLVALMLTVLLGIGAITIDYGHMAWQRRNLQNAADAAALAAAWELPDHKNTPTESEDSNIYVKALEYAQNNSPELSDTEVTFKVMNYNKEVKVDVQHTYNTFLGSILGQSEKLITATATAEKILPWWEGLLPFSYLNTFSGVTSDSVYPDFKTNVDEYTAYLNEKIASGYSINFWEEHDDQPSNYGSLYFETEESAMTDAKKVLNRSKGEILDLWGKDLYFDPGQMSSIENAHKDKNNGQTNLSDRLEEQGYSGYIIAVLPGKIDNTHSTGEKVVEWGDYVILYLENITINYDSSGKIITDNPVNGTLKEVYNLAAGEFPDKEVENMRKTSRLVD